MCPPGGTVEFLICFLTRSQLWWQSSELGKICIVNLMGTGGLLSFIGVIFWKLKSSSFWINILVYLTLALRISFGSGLKVFAISPIGCCRSKVNSNNIPSCTFIGRILMLKHNSIHCIIQFKLTQGKVYRNCMNVYTGAYRQYEFENLAKHLEWQWSSLACFQLHKDLCAMLEYAYSYHNWDYC